MYWLWLQKFAQNYIEQKLFPRSHISCHESIISGSCLFYKLIIQSSRPIIPYSSWSPVQTALLTLCFFLWALAGFSGITVAALFRKLSFAQRLPAHCWQKNLLFMLQSQIRQFAANSEQHTTDIKWDELEGEHPTKWIKMVYPTKALDQVKTCSWDKYKKNHSHFVEHPSCPKCSAYT